MRTFQLEEITKKCRAIVMFGPPTDTSGYKAGEFFQVTIDPARVSPGGDYIYFGNTSGDQITGWQRIEAITVCEILGEYNEDGTYPEADGSVEPLAMNVVRE